MRRRRIAKPAGDRLLMNLWTVTIEGKARGALSNGSPLFRSPLKNRIQRRDAESSLGMQQGILQRDQAPHRMADNVPPRNLQADPELLHLFRVVR
jgi:hypothetical protein